MNRRELLVGAASTLVAGAASPAFAQFKPTRPIEFVVHGGPGSGNDVFARQLTTMKVTNAGSVEQRIQAQARFARFFLGPLLETYADLDF